MLNFVWYVIIAILGGLLLQKCKVPGGMMVGAAIACGIANVTFALGESPSMVKIMAQVLTGVYIGINIDAQELKDIKYIFKPLLIVIIGLLITNIITGYIISRISSLDLMTSMLSAAAGGVSNMPLIAGDLGANPAMVAIFQSVRMIIGIGVFPSLISVFSKRKKVNNNQTIQNVSKPPKNDAVTFDSSMWIKLIMIIIVCLFIGWVGTRISFPSSYLIFPLLACIGFKMLKVNITGPILLRRVAQILSGIYIGTCFNRSDLYTLQYIIIPIILMIVLFVVNFLISGWIIHAKKYFGFAESLLAASPAGASDMALVTEDLGIQNTNLNLLHVLRLLVVVVIFPFILEWVIYIVP